MDRCPGARSSARGSMSGTIDKEKLAHRPNCRNSAEQRGHCLQPATSLLSVPSSELRLEAWTRHDIGRPTKQTDDRSCTGVLGLVGCVHARGRLGACVQQTCDVRIGRNIPDCPPLHHPSFQALFIHVRPPLTCHAAAHRAWESDLGAESAMPKIFS
jgi:hypothetical protein